MRKNSQKNNTLSIWRSYEAKSGSKTGKKLPSRIYFKVPSRYVQKSWCRINCEEVCDPKNAIFLQKYKNIQLFSEITLHFCCSPITVVNFDISRGKNTAFLDFSLFILSNNLSQIQIFRFCMRVYQRILKQIIVLMVFMLFKCSF